MKAWENIMSIDVFAKNTYNDGESVLFIIGGILVSKLNSFKSQRHSTADVAGLPSDIHLYKTHRNDDGKIRYNIFGWDKKNTYPVPKGLSAMDDLLELDPTKGEFMD